MPLNSDELELITCKSTKDFHIVEDPILLPCSFSVCRKCYESIKFCVICKKEHLIAVDEIYSNESVNQLIKENIKDFKLTIALKVEKELTGFEGKEYITSEKIIKIKNEIDLRVESIKVQMDIEHQKSFDKLDIIREKHKHDKMKFLFYLQNLSKYKKKKNIFKYKPQQLKPIEIIGEIRQIFTKQSFTKAKCTCLTSSLNTHEDLITCLMDDNYGVLISGSLSEGLKLWNLETKSCIRTIHTYDVKFAFRLKNGGIIIGSNQNNLYLFDINTSMHYPLNGYTGLVTCYTELKNGNLLIGYLDGYIRSWNFVAKKYKTVIKNIGSVFCLLELTNGDMLCVLVDYNIRLKKKNEKSINILRGHTSSVICLLELKNKQVVSGSDDKSIRIWNIQTKTCVVILSGHQSRVNCLVELRNGELLSGSSCGNILIWDLKSKTCIGKIDKNYASVNYLIELKNGDVVCASNTVIRVWKRDY